MNGFKFTESLKVTFTKSKGNGLNEYKTHYFFSEANVVLHTSDLLPLLSLAKQQILNKIQSRISEGSAWRVLEITEHWINVAKYEPLKGSSYIRLPKELNSSMKGLINLKNSDDKCFLWCHIRYLNPQNKDPQLIKIIDKEMVSHLNYNGVEFPVTSKDYNKIERQNQIRVNVFGYENKLFYPIYISKYDYAKELNLLLITEDGKNHYVLIKDFNRLMLHQTKHQHRKHFCMSCLQCFSSKQILDNHRERCLEVNGKQAVEMPDKENCILKFNNYNRQMYVPFLIYADFEAI